MKDERTILVVEDNTAFRTLVTNELTERGYTVQEASTGAEALERIDERAPDLILLDIKMPGMNGTEVLERIRKMGEWGSQVPVLIFTQLEDTQHMAQAVSSSVQGYFIKANTTPEGVADEVTQKFVEMAREQAGMDA